MALILPKGIVVNSPEIEGSIERIHEAPLDLADIARFWKVYTTTRRRLLDPTAERLENYWWRIWGSKKRELKGATVAKLFAYISDGHSFVPLRGPPNRLEASPPLERRNRNGPGASSNTAIHPGQSRPSTITSSNASRTPVVMPHPILKKTRGPSTTGPRPTARFISPHETEDEKEKEDETNSHVVVQPPSPTSQDSKTDKKTAGAGGKKKAGFAVSASTKKKRPVIVRRQSSQSSTDTMPKIQEVQASATVQSSAGKTPPTFSEHQEQAEARGKKRAQSKFQENFSPALGSTTKPPQKSSQTSDPNHLSPRKPTPRRERLSSLNESVSEADVSGDPGPSNPSLRRIENSQTLIAEHPTEEELAEIEVQRILLAEANACVQKPSRLTSGTTSKTQHEGSRILHQSVRARSDGSHEAHGITQILPKDTKGSTSAALALTDATGQLELGNAVLQTISGGSRRKDKGKGRDLGESRNNSMFAKIPVPPAGAASVPASTASLARSKSQLTLLVERDRASSSDIKTKGEKESP